MFILEKRYKEICTVAMPVHLMSCLSILNNRPAITNNNEIVIFGTKILTKKIIITIKPTMKRRML